jgi:hypothetical protein
MHLQVCVRSKADMDELRANVLVIQTYGTILVHYRELPDVEKEAAYSALHKDCGTTLVIATSGITTGTNPRNLFRCCGTEAGVQHSVKVLAILTQLLTGPPSGSLHTAWKTPLSRLAGVPAGQAK